MYVYYCVSLLKAQQNSEIAQSVKCLPNEHDDLSSIPRMCIKVPGMMVHACHPRAAKKHSGSSLGLTGYPVQLTSSFPGH